MNRFAAPLAVLFFAVSTLSSAAAALNGQNYVPLANWASANGLKTFWIARGSEIGVTNRATRLVFDKDSSTAKINGTSVALSFPVAVDKDVPLIAQLDLDKTIRPLIFPPKSNDTKKITTICLDPGHGGKDTGYHVGGRFFGHNEKAYTLPLALELRDQLKRLGFNVVLTRNADTYVDLPVRPAIANRAGADLFISLHFNAFTSGDPASVSGPETYCITPVGAASSNAQGAGSGPAIANRAEQKSLIFAYQIQKSLVQNLGVNDRGVRRARFAVLRDATMPAILIEGGYMTNPVEGKKIYDAAWRRQLAAAIVKGILNYQKLTAPPATNSAAANTRGAAVSKRAR